MLKLLWHLLRKTGFQITYTGAERDNLIQYRDNWKEFPNNLYWGGTGSPGRSNGLDRRFQITYTGAETERVKYR